MAPKTESFPYIHFACRENHVAAVKALLLLGARLDQRTSSKRFRSTPLLIACTKNDAAKGDKSELVEFILSHPAGKATVNTADSRGHLPLLRAAYSRTERVVRALITAGAGRTCCC